MQVATVGVEGGELGACRSHHLGVTVTHMRYIVDTVEVAPSSAIIQIAALPAHHVERLCVREGDIGPDKLGAFV